METPKTLQQAIIFFSDYANCHKYMVESRWPDGIVKCPRCGSINVLYMEKSRLFFCRAKHEKAKFSLKVGTIYEDSAIGLDKWLPATWLLTNSKNGISSYELARALGITQKSAWHMLGRIRKAMNIMPNAPKIGGIDKEVEADEAFIGGDPRNWHADRRAKLRKGARPVRTQAYNTTYGEKIAVLGLFDRESREIRAKVVPNVRRETLQDEILKTIELGSKLYTDEARSYKSLKDRYIHQTVNHAHQYVNGAVHTNSLENFWSLMKRSLRGTYVAVEPFHLDRYLAEQCFRFNTSRTMNDGQRFDKVMTQIVGKRLTYAELTGKDRKRVEDRF